MVSYSDSEVKIFHPLCEASLNWALKNLSLEKEYEVLHHQRWRWITLSGTSIPKSTSVLWK